MSFDNYEYKNDDFLKARKSIKLKQNCKLNSEPS